MPAINFKKQFADAVANGTKTQTIRRLWKKTIRPGDTLYLYTGMRTSQCKILRETKCLHLREVSIRNNSIKIDGVCLCPSAADEFAKKDGFDNRRHLVSFIEQLYTLPFRGVLIEWE